MWRSVCKKGLVGIDVDSDGDGNFAIIIHIDSPEQCGTNCAELATATPVQVASRVLETWLCF